MLYPNRPGLRNIRTIRAQEVRHVPHRHFATLLIPGLAFAAGGDDKPPKPTKTTKECTGGKIWDSSTQSCVGARSGHLDDDTLFGTVR